MVLTPEKLSSWPPKLMPPRGWAAWPWRVTGFAKVPPPASWRAEPVHQELGETRTEPLPAAVGLARRTAPELIWMPPVQPVLSADSTSVPSSFL